MIYKIELYCGAEGFQRSFDSVAKVVDGLTDTVTTLLAIMESGEPHEIGIAIRAAENIESFGAPRAMWMAVGDAPDSQFTAAVERLLSGGPLRPSQDATGYTLILRCSDKAVQCPYVSALEAAEGAVKWITAIRERAIPSLYLST